MSLTTRSRRTVSIASLCLLLVMLTLGWGCAQRSVGDIDAIEASGKLRVLVRPGFADGFTGGRARVDERLLIEQLAGRLGVEVDWIEVKRHDQLLRWLHEGRGDITLARFSPAALWEAGLAASPAVDWVEDVFVTSVASPVEHLKDLETSSLYLHRSADRWFLRRARAVVLGDLLPVPEEISLETILHRVRSGRYQTTLTDSRLVEGFGGGLRTIDALGALRPLVWGMRQDNPRLRSAVDRFLFAEQVLKRTSGETACRDLAEIQKVGEIRLVTRNSPTTCTIERGGLEGFEYELAWKFASEIGVRLVLAIPPPGVDPLTWLELGQGDLVALHEPIAPRDENRFRSSIPYRWVDLVSVVAAKRETPFLIDDLAGVTVGASRVIGEWISLIPFEPPIEIASLGRSADSLTALREVARGNLGGAVVDSDTAAVELFNRPNLKRGPTVLADVGLVWIFNSSSPELRRRADRYLRIVRKSGMVRQLGINMLTSWRPYVPSSLPVVPEGALTPYDEVLQWSGLQHNIDWRLLASLMYEESRFDPDAVGPGGSAGLFQFMPFTWRELGVEDPHHPSDAIEAGARYLRKLMDQFPEADLPDQVAMAIASFNVGPRHVQDARQLAAEIGFDRKVWKENVETAMLIIDDPEVARRYPAGMCRCRRAVAYTRRILRRYALYAEQFPPG